MNEDDIDALAGKIATFMAECGVNMDHDPTYDKLILICRDHLEQFITRERNYN